MHYFTDLLTNASIIVALSLSLAGWPGLDPIFAIGIAFYRWLVFIQRGRNPEDNRFLDRASG